MSNRYEDQIRKLDEHRTSRTDRKENATHALELADKISAELEKWLPEDPNLGPPVPRRFLARWPKLPRLPFQREERGT